LYSTLFLFRAGEWSDEEREFHRTAPFGTHSPQSAFLGNNGLHGCFTTASLATGSHPVDMPSFVKSPAAQDGELPSSFALDSS
jgi:hypothetical protein